MSLQPNIRGSPNPISNKRLPVPPPGPAAPLTNNTTAKISNTSSDGTAASNLTVASGSICQVGARRSSPPRRTGEETTFQQKLGEIKRMRNRASKNGENRMTTALLNQAQQEAVQHNQQQLQQPKRKVVINGKPALDMHGDWALMQSSSGKKYYFNVKTMTNTWVRPKEWPASPAPPHTTCQPSAPPVQKANVSTTAPTQPPQSFPPQPPQPCKNGANESEAGTKKFQMKISGSSSMSKPSGLLGLPGIDEYEENEDAGNPRDSNSNTKDDNSHGQTQGNKDNNREHKRKRHGKSRRKSHGEDKSKPQELPSTAIDNSNGQQPSGFRAMGDNSTDETTNANKNTNGKHDSQDQSSKKRHHRRKARRSADEKEPPEKRPKGRHKSRSRSHSRSRSRSRSNENRRYSDRSCSRSYDSYHSDGSYSHSSYSSYSDSYSDYSRSRSRRHSRSRSHSPRSERKTSQQQPFKDVEGDALAAAVLAAKAKVESQMANTIAPNTQGGVQEPSEGPPPSHFRSSLPVPGSVVSGNPSSSSLPQNTGLGGQLGLSLKSASTMLETTSGNTGDVKTWVSEYNFPAVLSRCKFPKEYDAIHELQTNKTKKRMNSTLVPLPADLNPTGDPLVAVTLRRNMFFAELKDSNNRYRLLCEKFGSTVYKIPDDLWERNYQQFQVELKPGYYLEARPHAYTEDDKPVYTRTGKVAKKVPFPEDVVRCHAVMQALSMDLCHCVYANKTYTIEKDNTQWKKDLEEAKRFLDAKGFH